MRKLNEIGLNALRWFRTNLLPSIAVSLIALFVVIAIGEAYFRLSRPFFQATWPSRFDAKFGFNFVPGAEVRWTNHFDYWVTEKANSLGFLDREPSNPSEKCHVALIGDSFVEAAQVNIAQKAQVLLENLAAQKQPELQLTASGYGYSGTGQLNQLPFYDLFVRPQHPHLVVLVFVGNDFRNNSTILESISNGWDPDYPPRLFARRTSTGIEQIQIAPDWQQHLLPGNASISSSKVVEFLRRYSAFFDWTYRKTNLLYPQLFRNATTASVFSANKARFEEIKARKDYSSVMANWQYEGNPGELDLLFDEKDLPDVFLDALDLTDYALREFKRRVEADNGHLIILATSQLSLKSRDEDPDYKFRQLNRLRKIAGKNGIPLIDQYELITSKGGDPLLAQFPHDGHWSPQGHIWAAEAIWTYLEKNSGICR